jgi:DNA polymerase-3 subunit gamma/tau
MRTVMRSLRGSRMLPSVSAPDARAPSAAGSLSVPGALALPDHVTPRPGGHADDGGRADEGGLPADGGRFDDGGHPDEGGQEQPPLAGAGYVALYRRFRPQRFDELVGQEHVRLALRNSVRDGHVGHAYLFSGPRGTGKTSTARILAKALNCAAPEDGEPCGRCPSCVEIAAGRSVDVHELDAASNNGVEAMRDLVAHAALGTPGRFKVYIVDEVHMLSSAAANALLKTLEEPPPHVVFVLATTDPQKVPATIKSRTQHFEFRLLGSEELRGLVSSVANAAGVELDADAIASVLRRARGSARDALSALDQLMAGAAFNDEASSAAALSEAIAERHAPQALAALERALQAGADPQRVAVDLVEQLRQGFLGVLAPDLMSVVGEERERVIALAKRMGLAALVRALEVLGAAQVAMRDAPDPRLHLEVAIVRLVRSELDSSELAILDRLARLERVVHGREAVAAADPAASDETGPPEASFPGRGTARQPDPPNPKAAGDPRGSSSPLPTGVTTPTPDAGPHAARAALRGAGREPSVVTGPSVAGEMVRHRPTIGALRAGAVRAEPSRNEEPPSSPAGTPGAVRAEPSRNEERPASPADPSGAARGQPSRSDEPSPQPADPPGAASGQPSRDDLVEAWGDSLLARLPPRARARFCVGRFLAAHDGIAEFALPNEQHRAACEELRPEVERVLAEHFGRPVVLQLVVDPEPDDAEYAPPAPARAGRSQRAAHGSQRVPRAAREDAGVEPQRVVQATLSGVEDPADDGAGGSEVAAPGTASVDQARRDARGDEVPRAERGGSSALDPRAAADLAKHVFPGAIEL